MYITITFLPTISSIYISIIANKIGEKNSIYLATTIVASGTVLSYIAYNEVVLNDNVVYVEYGDWVSIGLVNTKWSLIYDSITITIYIVVLTISSIVHIYSIDYIAGDPHKPRFFSWLSLFTGAILVLVTADNYIILFVGWEGIGIASFLLIGFWYTRIEAIKSALKALIINRIGDIAYTLAAALLYASIGTLGISSIELTAARINEYTILIIGTFLIIAAIGKSAQFGLHTWLPDAINGPTPVSALIHAATLVTAGVYLLIRTSILLELSNTLQIITLFIGATTALFAATTGITQNDLKTVIAYSTCSQLGYMLIAIGLSQYNVALYHLINHAFFKAILFLSAGAVIHATIDQQDTRRLGSLLGLIPLTYSAILTASLSLMAIPGLSGFYSKDQILELALGQWNNYSTYVYILGTVTAGITALYSIRLLSVTFLTSPIAGSIHVYIKAHDGKSLAIIPLIILSIFGIFGGFYTTEIYTGMGSSTMQTLTLPNNTTQVEAEFSVPTLMKLLPLIVTISGSVIGLRIYHYKYDKVIERFSKPEILVLYGYSNNKWNIDTIINEYIINRGNTVAYKINSVIEKGIADKVIGPEGLSEVTIRTSKKISNIDTNNLHEYVVVLGIGIIFIPTISMIYENISTNSNYQIFLIVLFISTIWRNINLNIIYYLKLFFRLIFRRNTN